MKERYKKIRVSDHPNASANGQIREHIYVMSMFLGRPLKKGEVVHHIDNNPFNNNIENLMLFSSNAEHTSHHARELAFQESGDYDKKKCAYCKKYDDPTTMYVRPSGVQAWHRECAANYKSVKSPKTGPYRFQKERDASYGIQRVSK